MGDPKHLFIWSALMAITTLVISFFAIEPAWAIVTGFLSIVLFFGALDEM